MEESKIVKYIVGEASIEESKEMITWLESSEKNRHEFEKLKETWQKSAEIKDEFFDTDLAWDTFKVKNLKLKTATKTITLNPFVKWAAAAVILVGLMLGVNQYLNPNIKVNSFANTLQDPVKEIQLKDGSKITLVEGQIKYDENFNKKTRPIDLKGKAYFDVTSNKEKKFTVLAGNCKIEVLGTAFEVVSTEDFISVSVTEGKVAFNTPHGGKLLSKGEASLYSLKENKLSKKEFKINAYAYATRSLSFKKERLSKAVKQIEKLYQVEIDVDEAIAEKLISTQFKDESLENVLQVLELTLNIDISKQNGKIKLSRKEEGKL